MAEPSDGSGTEFEWSVRKTCNGKKISRRTMPKCWELTGNVDKCLRDEVCIL